MASLFKSNCFIIYFFMNSFIADARRFTPSSICSNDEYEKFKRIVFLPLPSQKKTSPVTKATLFLIATWKSSFVS